MDVCLFLTLFPFRFFFIASQFLSNQFTYSSLHPYIFSRSILTLYIYIYMYKPTIAIISSALPLTSLISILPGLFLLLQLLPSANFQIQQPKTDPLHLFLLIPKEMKREEARNKNSGKSQRQDIIPSIPFYLAKRVALGKFFRSVLICYQCSWSITYSGKEVSAMKSKLGKMCRGMSCSQTSMAMWLVGGWF